jgi:hypothetical protein
VRGTREVRTVPSYSNAQLLADMVSLAGGKKPMTEKNGSPPLGARLRLAWARRLPLRRRMEFLRLAIGPRPRCSRRCGRPANPVLAWMGCYCMEDDFS